MAEQVEYRFVPGTNEFYRVGSDGTVWSRFLHGSNNRDKGPWKIKRPTPGRTGYLKVKIRRADGSKKWMMVHRLVLESFVGPCPDEMQARHFPDRNPANCRLDNLSWGTPLENAADKKVHGTLVRGSTHWCARLTDGDADEIRLRFQAGESIRSLSKSFGVVTSMISSIISGKKWKHTKTAWMANKDKLPGRPRGSAHVNSKLNEELVRSIRMRYGRGESLVDLAAEIGVDKYTIWSAATGKTWAHVEGAVKSKKRAPQFRK